MLSARSDGGSTDADLPVEPELPTNLLLLAPSMAPATDDACAELLSRVEPAETDLLVVTADRSPDERLAALGCRGERLPAKVAVVSVGDDTRSAASAGRSDPAIGDARFAMATVPEPGDLTGLGMRVSQALETWNGDGNRSVVCFGSLTTLLHSADASRVFQLLDTITSRIEALGAVAHYHLDPNAHDDRTVAVIRSLFDVVLAYRDGAWHRE